VLVLRGRIEDPFRANDASSKPTKSSERPLARPLL